ncbi:MAG: hypothetical protein KDA85_08575, partial [Planctomycetaceae bacterium]|nr:hypothetical protein [Planctomycetaceae bacterium]
MAEEYDDIEEIDEIEEIEEIEEVQNVEQLGDPEAARAERDATREKGRRQLARGRLAHLGDKFSGGAVRPESQSVFRSPLVLTLLFGTAFIALIAVVLWKVIVANDEEHACKQALEVAKQEQYGQAEKLLTEFLSSYPKTPSEHLVRMELHKCRVGRTVMVQRPNPTEGLRELEQLISICKEYEEFRAPEERENVRRYAHQLTYAGAVIAEKTQEQEALDVSRKAMEIQRMYSPDRTIPPLVLERLEDQQRAAEAAILRRTVFRTAVVGIRKEIENRNSIRAVEIREELLDSYPVFVGDKEINAILDEILKSEQTLTVREDLNREAVTSEQEGVNHPSLALTLRTEAVTGQVSQNRLVFAVGIDSCFGIDADT